MLRMLHKTPFQEFLACHRNRIEHCDWYSPATTAGGPCQLWIARVGNQGNNAQLAHTVLLYYSVVGMTLAGSLRAAEPGVRVSS